MNTIRKYCSRYGKIENELGEVLASGMSESELLEKYGFILADIEK